jgi:hypothetical protein
MVTPALSILVLTEDSSPHAHETVSALARRGLQLVDEHTATQRIRFQPTDARRAVRANMWQSRRPHPQLVDLRREIARKVLEDGAPGYVLFHFDGDRPWSERQASPTIDKFQQFVRGLRPLVEQNLKDRGLLREGDDADALVNERLGRVCEVVPHYSIESWLYQSTGRLRELCRGGCGRHLDLIDQWETDRSLLDEVRRPKDEVCVGSSKNRDLAESITRRISAEIHDTRQSFHATVERLQSCPGLREALRATWADDAHGSSSRSRR